MAKKPSIKDKRASQLRTICEVHREIYDKIQSIDSDFQKELMPLLEEAYGMAKKMNNKLRQYKFNYDDEWWKENKNYGEALKRRKNEKSIH